MAYDIGARVGIDGESSYKKSISNLVQQSKTLKAEMDAVAKGFREASDDSTDFEKKSQVLNKQIEVQSKLVEELQAAVERSSSSTGEHSTETEKLRERLFKAQGVLADMQNDLTNLASGEEDAADSASEMGDEIDDTADATKDADKQTNIFAETLKSKLTAEAIIGGIKAIGNAFKDAAESIKEAINGTVEWADELATLSTQTGVSQTELQKMEYMAGLVDVDVSTITDSMKKLTNNMDSASKGTGATADAFKELGVSVTDSEGNLRSNQDVFYEVIDALGKIENDTERDAKAMDIFGKSAQELNPLIKQGSDNLKAFGDEAVSTGYVLSDEAVGNLTNVSDAFERIDKAGENAKRNAVAAMAPAILEMANLAVPAMQEFASNFSAMFNGEMSVGDFVTYIMGQITNLTTWVAENAPMIMAIGTEIIVAILNGLADGDIAGQALTLVSSLQQGIADNLPQIMEAGVNLLVSLVTGLTQPSSLSQLIQSGLSLLLSLVKGIINALPQLSAAVPQIIQNLVSTIIQNLPLIITSGIELIGALTVGLIQSIPDIILAIPQIIKAIIDAFKNADWQSIGTNIMNGIKQGLNNMVQNLVKSAKEIGNKILNGVKGVLGIASPSKVFRDEVGKMIPKGLEEGINKGMPSAIRDMEQQMDNLVIGASATISGVSSVAPIGTNIANNYGGFTINVNAQDGQSANDIANEVMYRIQNAVNRREAVFA